MDGVIFNTSVMAGSNGMSLLAKFCTDRHPYCDVSFKIKLVCPLGELSSAERSNAGSYNTELLEVSESQQKTGCSSNMMLKVTDMQRAASQEKGGGGHEVKGERARNVRVEKLRTKWGMEQQEYHSLLHCFTWWNPSLKGQLLCNSPRLTR